MLIKLVFFRFSFEFVTLKLTALLFFSILIVVSVFIFQDRVSLCVPGRLRTCSVDQASLECTEILLLMPPECWD